ncbi:MAG: DNA polymerase Y family protein, partial [Actinobacteria bacterium]|nr:DNA polymerase Y family protein [Actinomycetota bacterium]NIU20545.1 DNA polymerase Y family protein [Actinomycetota bacterium]NIV88555.1 DNA polymerase Y family protein [Actinomycetota bacterium]NIW30114.1 DNA polymerase Y family protein [Actinomycetota bacterium]NIX22546.1 DNA polymerase Y family protein [Actinomycetota bacterium]
DEAREARAFEPVAAALDDVTPRIEITRPGTCAFATRGPSRYFGGDEAVAELVRARMGE